MTNKEMLEKMSIEAMRYSSIEEQIKIAHYQCKIEKALEINELLKNKRVNIHFDLVVKDTYEEYLAGVEGSKVILTEEEWVELKEWLKDEE